MSPSHGLQIFTNCPSVGPSHGRLSSTNFSNIGTSHGVKFSMNCPSVGPSHGVQSFRNRLLQRGSPTRSQALPANLLRRELLSPQVHRSCQEPAPAQAPYGVTASFRHPPALVWGPFHRLQVDICSTVDLHGLQEDSLPHHGLLHGLQWNLCSWSTSCPSFFTNLGVCRVVSLTYSHSSLQLQLLLRSNFSPFLHTLSQSRYHHH